jgi:hypothetical protein
LKSRLLAEKSPIQIDGYELKKREASYNSIFDGGLIIPLRSENLLTELGAQVGGNAAAVVGFAVVKDLFPIEMAGTAVGAANFFAFLGAGIYQPMTGYLT